MDGNETAFNKQIYLVGERKIHRNTNNYSNIVDVSVSVRDRNVDNVRIIGCVLGDFLIRNETV